MIILITTIQAQSGKGAALETALRGMIAPTAKEPGALEYRMHRSLQQAETFFFYEKYADKAAMDAHLTSPHFYTLMETAGSLLAGEPSMDTLEFLDGVPEIR